MKFALSLFTLFFTLASSLASAEIANELDANQMNQVLQGHQLLKSKDPVPGSAWPRLTIFQFIPGVTPREAAAMTMAWDQKASYSSKEGGLMSSVTTQETLNGADASVDYEVKVPILGSEKFTMENKVFPYNQGQGFEVDSVMTKSERTKSSKSATYFESVQNGTLMKIISETNPPFGGGLATNMAIQKTQLAADDFVKHAVALKASNSQEFQAELAKFDRAMQLVESTGPKK